MTGTALGGQTLIVRDQREATSRRYHGAAFHRRTRALTASNTRHCPVCGTAFRGSSRRVYDKRKCGQKAALLRNAETRRSTRAERYARYLRLGGSSRPV